MGPLKIRIKYFGPDVVRIQKIEVGDWIDLRAVERVVLQGGGSGRVRLGVAMQLPAGYEAHLAPRSSTFANWKVLQPNSPGVIDESYCGDGDEWQISVYATEDTVINKGDKICHFRIVEKMPAVEFEEVDSLGNTDRGGFGSTGKR